MQRRRMPRNAKRASGAVVCAVALLSGCSGHPLADTAREALQAVTAGEVLPAPLARAYLLLGLSLALNAVMLLCWAGGQLARLGRLVRRMSARQKKRDRREGRADGAEPEHGAVCSAHAGNTVHHSGAENGNTGEKTGTEIQPAGKGTGRKAACAKDGNTKYFKRIGDRRMRMNRIKKVSRPAACLLALLLCVTLFASTAFAAGGALGADRNGTPYTYVIGYMYSGSSQTVNTREIFTSPNNYDIWLCPVCCKGEMTRWAHPGDSTGTESIYAVLWIRYCGSGRGHEHPLRAGAAQAQQRAAFKRPGYTSRSTYRCTRAAITAMTSPSRPACRSARPRVGSGTARWCVFRAERTQARACRTGAQRRATTAAASITMSIKSTAEHGRAVPRATPQ